MVHLRCAEPPLRRQAWPRSGGLCTSRPPFGEGQALLTGTAFASAELAHGRHETVLLVGQNQTHRRPTLLTQAAPSPPTGAAAAVAPMTMPITNSLQAERCGQLGKRRRELGGAGEHLNGDMVGAGVEMLAQPGPTVSAVP